MFADYKVMNSDNENDQKSPHEHNKIIPDCNICPAKMAFCGKLPVRSNYFWIINQRNKLTDSTISVANFHIKVKLITVIN
jgi:hypothetical protein